MTTLTQNKSVSSNADTEILIGARGIVAEIPEGASVTIGDTCDWIDGGERRNKMMRRQTMRTMMKMIPASAALLAGSLGFLATQAVPTSAAEPAVCEGSAYYCDQFAYNCTLNHGRFINFQPHNQRFVTYGCELPEHVSVDLFTGNLASTWLVPIGSDNNDDDSGNDPSDDPGQDTPNPTNPGGDDDIPGQDDPVGTID